MSQSAAERPIMQFNFFKVVFFVLLAIGVYMFVTVLYPGYSDVYSQSEQKFLDRADEMFRDAESTSEMLRVLELYASVASLPLSAESSRKKMQQAQIHYEMSGYQASVDPLESELIVEEQGLAQQVRESTGKLPGSKEGYLKTRRDKKLFHTKWLMLFLLFWYFNRESRREREELIKALQEKRFKR